MSFDLKIKLKKIQTHQGEYFIPPLLRLPQLGEGRRLRGEFQKIHFMQKQKKPPTELTVNGLIFLTREVITPRNSNYRQYWT